MKLREREDLGTRFWSKVCRSDNQEDCWNWRAGSLGQTGYGSFTLNRGQLGVVAVNQRFPAHRIAWMLHNNTILTDEHVCVMHSCDNRLCCNPHHLSLGTRRDNAADRHQKHRSKNGTTKLTLAQAEAIRSKYVFGKYGTWRLAKEFGISEPQARRIVKGTRWKTSNQPTTETPAA